MKHKIPNSQAEANAQKLSQLNAVTPDKRKLLRSILASAPDTVARQAQLNGYFASTHDEPESVPAGWLAGTRAYIGLGVIVLILLGGGVLWFNAGRFNTSQTANQFNTSQISANGQASNAVNAITSQTSSEASAALSSQVDTTAATGQAAQLQQMQDALNAKF